MYRLEREDFVRYPFLALWALLAFQAGFINTFGFLATGRSVSHVTGFALQWGVAFANDSLHRAIDMLLFPGFFVFGAFVSALFTSARIEKNLRPFYGRITLLMPAILLLLFTMGHGEMFGPFGEEFKYTRDFFLLFSLAFFCGMQNGCFATMTKGQIRTTHLTGVSTDIGTDMARLLFGKLPKEEKELTRRTQLSRLLTVGGFALGSVFSAVWSPDHGYNALIMPFATSIAVYFAAHRTSSVLDRRAVHANRRRRLPLSRLNPTGQRRPSAGPQESLGK